LLRSLGETQREKNKQFDEKENSIEERERELRLIVQELG
jgi:hypothetical protein